MGTTFRPVQDLEQRKAAKNRVLARRASLTNLPPAPILSAFAACFVLRAIALMLDAEHRWWLPITLVQRSEYGLIGDAIIVAPLAAAVSLLRRMTRANEWEEIIVLAVAGLCHAQLLLPWGRQGGMHGLCTFGALFGYAWLLCQAAYRNRAWLLGVIGVGMATMTCTSLAVLHFDNLMAFGVLEHLLLFGLLLGFWRYDCEHVARALVRESSPKTSRENNIRPPFL